MSNQINKKQEYCTSCLFPDQVLIHYSCQHKCCENCVFLSILLNDNKDENAEIPKSNVLSQYLSCFICYKGTTKILIQDFISKRIQRADKLQENNKCEGCDDEGIQNTSYCINCKTYFCDKCEKIHSSIKAFESHLTSKVYNHTSFNQLDCKCELENKSSFICETCKMNICTECLILNHIDHSFEPIKSEQDESIAHSRVTLKGKQMKTNSLDSSNNPSSVFRGTKKKLTNKSCNLNVNEFKNSKNDFSAQMTPTKNLIKTPESPNLKHFKPRGSLFSSSKSPKGKGTKDDAYFKKKEIERMLKEMLINLGLNPADEIPKLFTKEEEQIFDKEKQLKQEDQDEQANSPLILSKQAVKIEKNSLILENKEKEIKEIFEFNEEANVINKNKIFDENSVLEPLYKLEKESSEKLKKNLHNLCILLEFINTLSEEIADMYQKRSISNIDKINSNLKELKQYFKKLKLHIDNNKSFSVVQIQLLERNLYELIKKGKEKEIYLNKLILKEIITDDPKEMLLKSPYHSRASLIRKDNDKSIRLLHSQINNEHKTDILHLQPSEIISSYEMSTSSMPNMFASIYTGDKRLFLFWINQILNCIDGMQIFHSSNNEIDNIENLILKNTISKEERLLLKGGVEERRISFKLKGNKGTINSIRSFTKLSTNEYYLVSCSNEGVSKIYKIDADNKVVLYKNFELKGINIFSSYLYIPPKELVKQDTNPHLILCAYKKNFPIKILNLDEGNLIKDISIKGFCFFIDMIDLAKENPNINSSSHLKNKLLLLISVLDVNHELLIYDYQAFTKLISIKLDAYVNALFFFEEYNQMNLIINDRNGQVLIIGLENGKIKKKLSGLGYYSLAKWDNRYFLSCGKTTILEVLEISSLKSIKKYSEFHKDSIRNVFVSPYPGRGLSIFTYGEDKSIKCWTSLVEANCNIEVKAVIDEKND